MTIDRIIMLAGLQVEAVLLVLLAGKRVFSTMPVFTIYIGCSLGIDFTGFMIADYIPKWYLYFCIVNAIVDAGFFVLLVHELCGCVLRYNRATSLPRPLVFLVFAVIAAVMSTLGRWSPFPHLTPIWQITVQAFQVAAIVQAAAFLTLTSWTGLKGLRWPERELQVATGLGLYSIVALAVAVAHTHLPTGHRFHWLDLLGPASYLGILVYWVAYFAFETRKTIGIRSAHARYAASDHGTMGSQTCRWRT